jgi:glucokinase
MTPFKNRQNNLGEQLAIGVDLGGTKIAFGLVDRAGHEHASYRLPTVPEEGIDAVIGRIVLGIKYLLSQTTRPVAGIGIGSPGQINPHTGMVYLATNLGWHDVPLTEGVRQKLSDNLPLWVHNDANASAIGEMFFGAGRGCDDFMLITLGTGVGGAAISAGQLVLGAQFVAMEVGHIPLIPNGRLCKCGAHGCSEMYASGTGLMAGLQEHLPHYPFSVLADKEVTTEDVLKAARAGDDLGNLLINEAVDGLLPVILPYIGLFNPGRIVIGGGLGLAAWDLLGDRLTAKLHDRLANSVFPDVPILKSEVVSSAVGAASVVWYELDRLAPE